MVYYAVYARPDEAKTAVHGLLTHVGQFLCGTFFPSPRTHEKVFEICNVYIKDENFNCLQTDVTNLSVNKQLSWFVGKISTLKSDFSTKN